VAALFGRNTSRNLKQGTATREWGFPRPESSYSATSRWIEEWPFPLGIGPPFPSGGATRRVPLSP
jgi:hypothetical protein